MFFVDWRPYVDHIPCPCGSTNTSTVKVYPMRGGKNGFGNEHRVTDWSILANDRLGAVVVVGMDGPAIAVSPVQQCNQCSHRFYHYNAECMSQLPLNISSLYPCAMETCGKNRSFHAHSNLISLLLEFHAVCDMGVASMLNALDTKDAEKLTKYEIIYYSMCQQHWKMVTEKVGDVAWSSMVAKTQEAHRGLRKWYVSSTSASQPYAAFQADRTHECGRGIRSPETMSNLLFEGLESKKVWMEHELQAVSIADCNVSEDLCR